MLPLKLKQANGVDVNEHPDLKAMYGLKIK